MRILLATGIYPPQIGGPATQVKTLFEGLSKEDNEVKVLTFGDLKIPGVDIVSRDKLFLTRYLKFFWRTLKLVKKEKIELIYAFDLFSVGLPCALVKILIPRVKFIIRLGGDYGWEKAVQKGRFLGSLKDYYAHNEPNFVENVVSNLVIKRADFLIFNASVLRDLYLKYRRVSSSKSTIIPNARAEFEFRKTNFTRKEKLKILFAGRIIAIKNLKRLIDAFDSLRTESFKEIILEIFGDGPEKQSLELYVRNKHLTDKVKFLDRLGREDLLKEMDSCDIMVLVSLTEVNPNFAIESLVLGKPIILTNQSEPCYGGYENDLIYYVDPFKVEDITLKLKLAISDLEKGKPFALRELPQEISIDARLNVEKHLKIFQCLKK